MFHGEQRAASALFYPLLRLIAYRFLNERNAFNASLNSIMIPPVTNLFFLAISCKRLLKYTIKKNKKHSQAKSFIAFYRLRRHSNVIALTVFPSKGHKCALTYETTYI